MDVIRALLDKQEIVELVLRYSTALDTRDWELLESCFVAVPGFDCEGFPPIRDFETIRASASAALAGLDASQHFVTNICVRLEGDTASVTSYLQAQHVRAAAGENPNYLVAGVYRDTVVREGRGWLFAHRRLEVLWTEGNPAVPTGTVATAATTPEEASR